MTDEEKIEILKDALEDILRLARLDQKGRKKYLDEIEELRGTDPDFYACAVGHIEAVARFALKDTKEV